LESQIYKIFIKEKILVLTKEENLHEWKGKSAYLIYKLEEFIAFINDQVIEKKRIIWITENPDETFNLLKSTLHYVVAAGGIVWNKENSLLMIFRRGKWDIPKGKAEPTDDTFSTTALREVQEECGVGMLRILHHFQNTYHIYFEIDKWVVKETYWYEMFCSDNGEVHPQTSEGITEAKWISLSDIPEKLNNTYGSIKALLKKVVEEGYGFNK
jgi:8-oxo-dGTP pyrophosphatase MutT (NUDIX family)